MRKSGFRKLAVTSPTADCGTPEFAAKLAISLARQIDVKIMLFDLDLRQPSLAKNLNLQNIGPRNSALVGLRPDFDNTCMRVGHNLALSLNNTPVENSAELLATRRTKALIEQIEREFEPDVLLFSMPPALQYDDVMASSGLFDAALVVARADRTTIEDVDKTERLISEQKPCLGVVLNGCRFTNQTAQPDE